jgi:hypothetical protein
LEYLASSAAFSSVCASNFKRSRVTSQLAMQQINFPDHDQLGD